MWTRGWRHFPNGARPVLVPDQAAEVRPAQASDSASMATALPINARPPILVADNGSPNHQAALSMPTSGTASEPMEVVAAGRARVMVIMAQKQNAVASGPL